MIEIREVRTKKDEREFHRFPFRLYKKSKFWVPPLLRDEINIFRPDKNPMLKHTEFILYLALRDNRVVGRIVGIVNHNEVNLKGLKQLRFGWFDFIDDMEVSRLLMETVIQWGQSRGMTVVQGPLGFTNMDKAGYLIEGFEELPTIATIYNEPYYIRHLEKMGFKPAADWVEYEFGVPTPMPDKVKRFADIVSRKYGLRIAESKKATIKKYVPQLFALINETHKDLHGFVPFSEKQIQYYSEKYMPLLNPDFVALILDKEDRLIGYAVAFPSYSRAFRKARGKLMPFGIFHMLRASRKVETADLYLIGIKDEYRNKGVTALIFFKIISSFSDKGVSSVESNPELIDNVNVQTLWRDYDRRQHKKRRLFIKSIS